MAKKLISLADMLKQAASDPANIKDYRHRTWLTRLDPEEQKDLLEVRERFRAGEYPDHCSAQWMHKHLQDNGAKVPAYDTFRRWLYRGE